MQNNYYFLKQLSHAIAQKINTNWVIGKENNTANKPSEMFLGECFSQNKDELVLGFCSAKGSFYIRATVNPEIGILSFHDEYHRAKKNSVNLFPELDGKRVVTVIQNLNERSFLLMFEDNYALLFKMHGRRSNIILFHEQRFQMSFNKKALQDQHLSFEDLDRVLDQSFESFEKSNGHIPDMFPTFGKEVMRYLEERQIRSLPLKQQWQLISDTIHLLDTPKYYLYWKNDSPVFTLIPNKETELLEDNPIDALNSFFYQYTYKHVLQREKETALRVLKRKLKQGENYINKNYKKLEEIDSSLKNEHIANILMAHLHEIPVRSKSIELPNFYEDNKTIKIKLKEDLSAQKNAESYYRKAKNQKLEIKKIEENIGRKENELNSIKIHIDAIHEITQIKALRKYLKQHTIQQRQKQEKNSSVGDMFRKFEYQGYEILVGKNAKNNDILTQKYAKKEDLWLHAKDVTGSHVIIRNKAGKPFPKDVIEKAATLAAYYSKRSADTLCPVIMTPKKFIRKTKDLADGQVIVEKEEVIMVIPERF